MLLRMFLLLSLSLVAATSCLADARLLVAAGGGDSLLPGPSLPALTLAMADGAEQLALPLALTADGQAVLFPEPTLGRLTDVAELFPERRRVDGDYHLLDFTLAEIRQLRLRRKTTAEGWPLSLAIATLEEALALIHQLEKSLGRQVGIFLELAPPALYRAAGLDLSDSVLATLAKFDHTGRGERLVLACADPDELQRLHRELLPDRQMDLHLLQLLEPSRAQPPSAATSNAAEDWLLSNSGLRLVAAYAWGIATTAEALIATEADGSQRAGSLGSYFAEAKRYRLHRLAILPTADSTAEKDLLALADRLLTESELDGVLTDSWRQLRQHRQRLAEEAGRQGDLPPFFSELQLKRPLAEGEEREREE
jgi:glycerophosphoryl diester phosphodiesterase